jgi:hypothetical protein
MIFVATKNCRKIKIFPLLFWWCCLTGNPGSGMDKNLDPGSGINIPDPQHWLARPCLPQGRSRQRKSKVMSSFSFPWSGVAGLLNYEARRVFLYPLNRFAPIPTPPPFPTSAAVCQSPILIILLFFFVPLSAFLYGPLSLSSSVENN